MAAEFLDPVYLVILGFVALLFFIFLMLRRTLGGFLEGFEEGRNR